MLIFPVIGDEADNGEPSDCLHSLDMIFEIFLLKNLNNELLYVCRDTNILTHNTQLYMYMYLHVTYQDLHCACIVGSMASPT